MKEGKTVGRAVCLVVYIKKIATTHIIEDIFDVPEYNKQR